MRRELTLTIRALRFTLRFIKNASLNPSQFLSLDLLLKSQMKNVTLSLLLVLLAAVPTEAQTVVGKYAGEFLSLGVGGRALGMGGAAAAIANDVTAGYWNPSGLAKINYPQVAFMHAQTFGNIVGYDYLAAAIPYNEKASFGLSVIRLSVSDIPNTQAAWDETLGRPRDDAENYITRFNAADYAVYVSYAASTPFRLSYGVNAKVILRNIGDFASAKGVGFDIGASYEFKNGILIGATLQDVTTTFLSWSGGRNELITPTAKLGGGYAIEALSGRFIVGVDTDVRFEGRKSTANFYLGGTSFNMRAGGEFLYKNLIAIRGGVDDIGRLTLGAGLKISKLNIDYGFAQFSQDDQLGNSHRISLQLELDQENFRRKGYVEPVTPDNSPVPESMDSTQPLPVPTVPAEPAPAAPTQPTPPEGGSQDAPKR